MPGELRERGLDPQGLLSVEVAPQPAEQRHAIHSRRKGRERERRVQRDAGLEREEARRRVPRRAHRGAGADDAPARYAEQIDRQERPEREARGLDRDAQDAKPGDLEREGQRARERVESEPDGEAEDRRRRRAVAARARGDRRRFDLATGEAPERQHRGGARQVDRSPDLEDGRDVEAPQQEPRGDEGACRGAEGVPAVEGAHRACCGGERGGQPARQQRKGDAHEEGRPDDREEEEEGERRHGERERAEPAVEQVVVEPLASEGEEADRELGEGEEAEAAGARDAVRDVSAGEVSAAEPTHEGRDDDRDREDVGPREDGQEPLPDHLVKQRGKARCEEHREQPRERRAAGPVRRERKRRLRRADSGPPERGVVVDPPGELQAAALARDASIAPLGWTT